MNRLRKLVESSEYGERTGRVAYLLRPETLPKPQEGFAWVEDTGFNAADAVLGDPSLKDAFKAAIAEGCAVVAARGAAKPAAQTAPANYNGRVYTVEIDGKPTVSFEAKSTREANELVKEAWFKEDLLLLTSEGQPLWDGAAPLRARAASEAESERYRGFAAEAEETTGDILLAFLVTLDNVGSDAAPRG